MVKKNHILIFTTDSFTFFIKFSLFYENINAIL